MGQSDWDHASVENNSQDKRQLKVRFIFIPVLYEHLRECAGLVPD
jgi:hypothetical protein